MKILEKLAQLGLALPPPAAPGGNYVPARRHGDLLYLAGVISASEGRIISGRLGADLSVEEGAFAARCCLLAQLASIQQELGDLDRVSGILSLNGYVRCTPEFSQAPQVINGASDLLIELWGESARHTRAAIGVTSLPKAAAVEIQMIVEVGKNS
jgi:enamine deaminase RidA (YjgF/YER057c/UK114 family)